MVHPVGVTDLRPYFTQIIGHNSVNVHRIPTKLGTEIRLNEPFKCTKFQPIGAHIRVLLRILQGVRKEVEEKNEEKKPKVWPLVSRKWLKRFSSNLECGLPYLAGTSIATLVSIG